MKNVIAVVRGHDENNYFLFVNEKEIIIPIEVMHRNCSFDGLMDATERIKNGTPLNLVEIKTDNGKVFYPNHQYYHNNKNKERSQRRVVGFHIKPYTYGVETEFIEFKTSFSCISGIKQTIVAFANSHHDGTILVGVNDEGYPEGLHRYLTPNEQNNQANIIKNQIKLETASLLFSQTLEITWETREGKTICRIHVPAWKGNILFLHQEKLFVRMGATNQLLKGTDLVDFIVNRYCQSA